MNFYNNKSSQLGVGLIEVMVALFVLAIGALSFAALQMTALRNANEANYRAHATMIMQDAIERIQSNRHEDQVAIYFEESNWPSAVIVPGQAPADWRKCITSSCTPSEIADWDINFLSWTVANSLPLGQIRGLSCGFNDLNCLVISWNEQDVDECTDENGILAGNDDASCVVMEVLR